MIPLDKLTVGSFWMKPKSGKRYQVMSVGIDAKTNGAVVIYKKLDAEDTVWKVQPLSDFFGTVIMSMDEKSKTYGPRFVPISEGEL